MYLEYLNELEIYLGLPYHKNIVQLYDYFRTNESKYVLVFPRLRRFCTEEESLFEDFFQLIEVL